MAPKKALPAECPEEIEFDADSESLLALDNDDHQSIGNYNSAIQHDYQYWMSSLLNDPGYRQYFDLEIKLKDFVGHFGTVSTISAHRLILATRNPRFAELLRQDKVKELVLVEPDIPADIFRTMVNYIYTGQVVFPRKVICAASLMYAARKYQVDTLYSSCRLWILRRIPRSEAKHLILLYQKVLDLHLDELAPVCFRLLEQRTSDVVKDPQFLNVGSNFISSFLDLDNFTGVSEREVFEVVLKWGQLRLRDRLSENAKGSVTLRQILDPFIYKLRLASIQKDHLSVLITDSGLFSEKEQLCISLFLLGRKQDLGAFPTTLRTINRNEHPPWQSSNFHRDEETFSLISHCTSSKSAARKSKSLGDIHMSSVLTMSAKTTAKQKKMKKLRTIEISKPIGTPEHRFSVHTDMNYFIQNMTQSDEVIRNIVANLPVPTYPNSVHSRRSSRGTLEKCRSSEPEQKDQETNEDPELLPPPFVRRIYRKMRLAPTRVQPLNSKPKRQSLTSVFKTNDNNDHQLCHSFQYKGNSAAALKS